MAIPRDQRPVNELASLRNGPLSSWANLELPRYSACAFQRKGDIRNIDILVQFYSEIKHSLGNFFRGLFSSGRSIIQPQEGDPGISVVLGCRSHSHTGGGGVEDIHKLVLCKCTPYCICLFLTLVLIPVAYRCPRDS